MLESQQDGVIVLTKGVKQHKGKTKEVLKPVITNEALSELLKSPNESDDSKRSKQEWADFINKPLFSV